MKFEIQRAKWKTDGVLPIISHKDVAQVAFPTKPKHEINKAVENGVVWGVQHLCDVTGQEASLFSMYLSRVSS